MSLPAYSAVPQRTAPQRAPPTVGACVLKDKMMAGFSKYSAAWKNVLEPITGTVVIYETDVVLSKAKKKSALWGNQLLPQNV